MWFDYLMYLLYKMIFKITDDLPVSKASVRSQKVGQHLVLKHPLL